TAHRSAVPAHFAGRIAVAAHQKAADYTVARTRLSTVDILIDTCVLMTLTLGGGLWAAASWTSTLPLEPLWRGGLLIVIATVVTGVVALPLSWYRTFVIEQRFGFNRMTLGLWLKDLIKAAMIRVVLGLPLVTLVLWLMARAGSLWWFYAWLAWVGFQALLLALYPTVIAPLFNKFRPLADVKLKERVDRLLARCGFAAKGLFVMDGSTRWTPANGYLTGVV